MSNKFLCGYRLWRAYFWRFHHPAYRITERRLCSNTLPCRLSGPCLRPGRESLYPRPGPFRANRRFGKCLQPDLSRRCGEFKWKLLCWANSPGHSHFLYNISAYCPGGYPWLPRSPRCYVSNISRCRRQYGERVFRRKILTSGIEFWYLACYLT